MKLLTLKFMLVLGLLPAIAIAQSSPTPEQPSSPATQANPVTVMLADVIMVRLDATFIKFSRSDSERTEFRKKLTAHQAKLDSDVVGAVKYANGKADLKTAIKECYSAAVAYRSSPGSLEQGKLDAKIKALRLEMKLAGIN